MGAERGPKIMSQRDETDVELKCQPCRICHGLLCYLHFHSSRERLIFHVIIEVPDRVYRESHYRKDESLGLLDCR